MVEEKNFVDDPDVAKGEIVEVYPMKRQRTLSNMYGSIN